MLILNENKSPRAEIEAELSKPKHSGPKWVHLFYDLAWAASFASFTGNGNFDSPMDTLNYFVFFITVLWMWVSQTLYSIHFYTNDWFHLLLTFLHLIIFGLIAATNEGYDVTTYIGHSPGVPSLLTNYDLIPEIYVTKNRAHLSILA
ncbi:unnamed protein product, partial [Rhizoctonia solani]